MKYEVGDIVRFKYKNRIDGLHEVTGYNDKGEISLTINECVTEFYADEKDLIFVCSVKKREDL